MLYQYVRRLKPELRYQMTQNVLPKPRNERKVMEYVWNCMEFAGSTQGVVLEEQPNALSQIVKAHKAPRPLAKRQISYKKAVGAPPPQNYLSTDTINDIHGDEKVTQPVEIEVNILRILLDDRRATSKENILEPT